MKLKIDGQVQATSWGKLLLRLFIWPLMLAILLITHLVFAIKRSFKFIRWGGEVSVYEKNEIKTIQDIYKSIKQSQPDRINIKELRFILSIVSQARKYETNENTRKQLEEVIRYIVKDITALESSIGDYRGPGGNYKKDL